MTAFPFRLGVHVSISGGIEKAVSRARELGCSAMQIFSRNPRGWEDFTPGSSLRQGISGGREKEQYRPHCDSHALPVEFSFGRWEAPPAVHKGVGRGP